MSSSELSFSIRGAVLDDCQPIAEFNTRLASETEGKVLDPSTIEKGVRALLNDPRHGRYFVAVDRGRIVGQMMHTREWSDWRNGEIWWIQSVYDLPEFRRRGIFRSLYRHLETLATEDSLVVGIRLYVEKQNSRAISTYESLGMADAGYSVMERMIRGVS